MNFVNEEFTVRKVAEDDSVYTLIRFPFHSESVWINNVTGKAEDVLSTPLVPNSRIITIKQQAVVEAERIFEVLQSVG